MHPEPVSVPSLIRSAAKAKPGQPLMSMVPLLTTLVARVSPLALMITSDGIVTEPGPVMLAPKVEPAMGISDPRIRLAPEPM